ncbi:uncharacterized protein LOC144538163 isoform X1 [Centroberyx gerrardi]
MTFDLPRAECVSVTSDPDCPLCPAGYYVQVNCSVQADGRISGVQCQKCSDCSAEGEVILTSCSWFSDSECGGGAKPVTRPTVAPPKQQDSPPGDWFIVVATVLSVAVVLLLCLGVSLLTCRRHHSYKGLSQL